MTANRETDTDHTDFLQRSETLDGRVENGILTVVLGGDPRQRTP